MSFKSISRWEWVEENRADLEREFKEQGTIHRYDRLEECLVCDGSGIDPYDPDFDCAECHGQGDIELTDEELFDEFASESYYKQVEKDKIKIEKYQREHANTASVIG